MSEFLNTAFTMPTAIFSGLLVLVVLYWLMVLLGALDLEIFDSLFGGAEGAADGLLDGAADGALDSAMEGALDGAADGAAEGAVETGMDQRGGCLSLLAIGQIPVSITGSFLVFFAWLFSMGGVELAMRFGGTASLGIGLAVAAGALGLGLVAAAVAIQPLRRLLRYEEATGRRDLVGRICTVTTRTVEADFGQAEVIDGGAGILIQVRCPEANDLTRGSRALIFNYDPKREVFLIATVDKRLNAASGPEETTPDGKVPGPAAAG